MFEKLTPEESKKRQINQIARCESCPLATMLGEHPDRPPISFATEYVMYMWRRDFSKGDSVDDHNYRKSISLEAMVTLDEAELIWNCALSRYRGDCQLGKPGDS